MNTAIIAAAGEGRRMGGDRPKQFLELRGEPIVIHTLRAFEECPAVDAVVVVLPEGANAEFLQAAERSRLRKVVRIVPGGLERQDSVERGLAAIRAETANVVVVHDAVRPFVTAEQIAAVVSRAQETGAAMLGLRAVDTVKEVDGDVVVRTIDRDRIMLAQTPQAFRFDLLVSAYRRAREENWSVTDDASLVERLGLPIAVVEGTALNVKITRPEDLELATFLLDRLSHG